MLSWVCFEAFSVWTYRSITPTSASSRRWPFPGRPASHTPQASLPATTPCPVFRSSHTDGIQVISCLES